MSTSKRPPNELESRLHQAALTSSKKEITAKQAEALIPDATARQNALNFLLGVGLLKGLTGPSGALSFRAVTKDEIVATKGLTGEENLVLSHIKSAANEGIWTKHLKAKTSLHQTVIDRCIKTLTQKRLIKRVPSVQHITRKIYMLEGLEPSISLTGGPWYTDNELDTEFIQNLTEACYRLICDISFPKRRSGTENALYPISNAPQYPTADSIRHSLRRAKLTETDLSVEHVEMLLNILILDGKVEKIPAFGSALWNTDAIPDGADESDDDESEGRKRKKKRKERARDEDEDEGDSDDDSARARKKRKKARSDEESDSDDARAAAAARKKKAKKKRAKSLSDDDSDADSDADAKSKRRQKKRRKDAASSDESDDDDERRRKKSKSKSKSKKRKKRRDAASSSEEEEEELGSSSEDSEEEERRRKKAKAKAKAKQIKQRSSSPAMDLSLDTGSGGSVYRAIREIETKFQWSEAPCELCPQFQFCKTGGPVNPRECAYYGEWLVGGTIVNEEEAP